MSKKKPLTITIEIPDQKLFSHITNAYGLVCQYRTAQGAPHENIENWMVRLMVEGANALYRFHDAEMKKLMEAQQEKAKVSAPSADNSNNTKGAEDVK